MDNYIDIYTLNDFHGALFPNRDEPGIARLGCYLLEKRREDPDRTVILSSGDMFQGTAVSNLSRGEVVVAAMNLIGFDAMTIGNHEFDWGVPALRRFCDGDEGNGEASFPFLAANIRLKASGELVPWARPYMVIAKENARVGVIGVIGEDLINDILGSLISDYEFTDMLAAIAEYSKVLREKEGCGIVIVAAHADTMAINERIAAAGADAIVNGHTHNYYAGEFVFDGAVIPYIQSGNNGKYLGHIRLYLDAEGRNIINVDCENIPAALACRKESEEINAILSGYRDLIEVSGKKISTAGADIDRSCAAVWTADVLRKHANAALGMINSGGIREAAFPIMKDEAVDYGRIFRMMPFENKVVTVEMRGKELLALIARPAGGKLVFSSNFDAVNGVLDGKKIAAAARYRVATVDFVLESPAYQIGGERAAVYEEVLLRDLLLDAIKASALQNDGIWQITKDKG